jgi:hypothetical protein
MMKKIFLWGGVAFLIFYVATRPNDAAGVVRQLGGGLQSIAVGFGDFLSNLA